MNTQEALDLFRAGVKEAGGQRNYAKLVGLSGPYIHDVYHGRRPLGPALLAALGLELIVHNEYRKVGE
jgi:DNA-binding transcriptional regulator YdaS (Cro superfamily)